MQHMYYKVLSHICQKPAELEVSSVDLDLSKTSE